MLNKLEGERVGASFFDASYTIFSRVWLSLNKIGNKNCRESKEEESSSFSLLDLFSNRKLFIGYYSLASTLHSTNLDNILLYQPRQYPVALNTNSFECMNSKVFLYFSKAALTATNLE